MCFVLLAETSGKESSEFINQYILSSTIIPTLKIIFKYLLIAIILEYVWQYIRKKIEKIRILCCNTISILIIPIFLFGTYHSRVYIKAYNTNSADEIRLMRFPKDHFSSIYKSALILNMMGQNMEDALIVNKKFYHNHNSRTTINDSINIVVVIGESHIKYHSQIYNYSLKTMPRLSKEHEIGRLHIFDDVITSSNSTSVIMKNILCCNNSSDQEGWYNYPTFTSIFKKAGYKVYLWDNQRDFDKTATYSFTLNSFLYNPELEGINYTKTNKESYTYDEDIVESFKKQVDYSKDKHNLVLFHLTGQHHDVRGRFPKSFNLFNADSIKRNEPFLGQEEKSYIADYDNATIYNDYVIYKIIETFRDSNTIIIYFSDHGEEVYDYRAQCGRDQGVMTANKLKYQYDVPFVIWCSEKFEANYPQKVASIKNSVNKPFILDNICHLLYNVAGVSTPVYRDSLDLISTNYKCKDRIINNTYNYEKIRFQ